MSEYTKPDHLYFVQFGSDGPIKIGVTSNPRERFRSLQTACPYPLTVLYCRGNFSDALGYEAKLHQRYEPFRLIGEWFRPDSEIIRFIRQIIAVEKSDDEENEE